MNPEKRSGCLKRPGLYKGSSQASYPDAILPSGAGRRRRAFASRGAERPALPSLLAAWAACSAIQAPQSDLPGNPIPVPLGRECFLAHQAELPLFPPPGEGSILPP